MSGESTILIVNNQSEELMQLISFLEGSYVLADATDGEACIEQVSNIYPDIILLDDMIVDPNCYDVCSALKSNPASVKIPIVLMSDLSAEELEEEIVFLKADDYICRPIDKNQLLEKLTTLLAFSRAS